MTDTRSATLHLTDDQWRTLTWGLRRIAFGRGIPIGRMEEARKILDLIRASFPSDVADMIMGPSPPPAT